MWLMVSHQLVEEAALVSVWCITHLPTGLTPVAGGAVHCTGTLNAVVTAPAVCAFPFSAIIFEKSTL